MIIRREIFGKERYGSSERHPSPVYRRKRGRPASGSSVTGLSPKGVKRPRREFDCALRQGRDQGIRATASGGDTLHLLAHGGEGIEAIEENQSRKCYGADKR